jgi:hypothetical protein
MLKPKTLAVVGVVAVLAGCGGSSSSAVSASTYVKSICSAIGPFEKNIQARSKALNLASITNVRQGKTALLGFLVAMVTDTDRAVAQLKAAGTPDVGNGKQIASGVVGAFARMKGALAQAAKRADSLPTNSPTAFKNGANKLGNNVESSIGGISAGLAGLKSPELEKAAAGDPTCKTLASS